MTMSARTQALRNRLGSFHDDTVICDSSWLLLLSLRSVVIIEVTGYTDSNGSAEMNTRLSEDRAKAVTLTSFSMRYIVAPGAVGEYGPAASNETKEGRAENRRAEVKVLVNKGVSGS